MMGGAVRPGGRMSRSWSWVLLALSLPFAWSQSQFDEMYDAKCK